MSGEPFTSSTTACQRARSTLSPLMPPRSLPSSRREEPQCHKASRSRQCCFVLSPSSGGDIQYSSGLESRQWSKTVSQLALSIVLHRVFAQVTTYAGLVDNFSVLVKLPLAGGAPEHREMAGVPKQGIRNTGNFPASTFAQQGPPGGLPSWDSMTPTANELTHDFFGCPRICAREAASWARSPFSQEWPPDAN